MPSNYATPGIAHLAVAGGLPGKVIFSASDEVKLVAFGGGLALRPTLNRDFNLRDTLPAARHVPAAKSPVVGAAREGRTESVRGGRGRRVRRTQCPVGANPQQRQIVQLASDGPTNRQISDRLFLSPRTVSTHLYKSYPKLGVARRNQLRDVIARADRAPD